MTTKAERVELAWVTFVSPARLDSQSSTAPAVAKSPTTSLFKGTWEGEPVVFIEDPSLRIPGIVPWSNVAAFGVQPAIEEAKKGPFGRPVKTTAESAA